MGISKTHPEYSSNTTTELLVLAGGFGTRLRSAVSDVPKPLAPVCNQPYLYYLIENWVEQGISSLTFLLHHQALMIDEFLNLQERRGLLKDCRLHTLTEPQALGTGGAVAYAVQQFQLSGQVLVANADTWLGSSIMEVSTASAPAIATVKVINSERYGKVTVQNGKVAAFEEKQQSSGPGWINAGLYHLHTDIFQNWDGQPFSMEQSVLPKLAAGGQLNAVPLETDFIDIGVPEDYFRFCRWVESGKEGSL
ncbi:MAG: sugar phosphate nucleotidyltransferase [Deltaproteobacteria bacterium]